MVQVGPKILISFGIKAEPPALPRRDDVLIPIGATAPKSYLSPLKMRTSTAAGGSLSVGKTSTTTRITFYQPCLWFCLTEETNYEKASTQYASYYSSFSWINNQLLASTWQRIIRTKLTQTLMFDPGGFKGRLRACSYCVFWRMDDSESSSCRRSTGESFMSYVSRSIAVSPQSGWFENVMPSTIARGYLSYEGERMSGNAMEGGA